MAKAPRVVAFGGGIGLPLLLSGLRQTSGDGVCGVVTIADDGGSSGRLRQELGVAPPGDIRRCVVALSERRRLAEVFEYRFEGGVELRDHSVGNIIIAALADMSGGFCEGVQQAARFLRIKGSVQPAATESLTLVFHHADGSVTRGESTVGEPGVAVRRVGIEPEGAVAPAAVIQAVERADAIVLSPGSLYEHHPGAAGRGGLRRPGGVRRPGYLRGEHHDPARRDGGLHALRPPRGDRRARRAGGHRRAGAPGAAARAAGVPVPRGGSRPGRATAGRSSGSACACALRRCSRTRSARRPGTTPSGMRVPCSTWRLPERRRCVRLPEGSAAAVTGPASAWRGGPSGPPP